MSDILEGNTNVWEYGSGDNFLKTKGNVWKTILKGNIPKGTYKSALYSPKFDLSNHQSYHLNFDIGMQVEFLMLRLQHNFNILQIMVTIGKRIGTAPEVYNNGIGQSCFITSKIFTDRTGWAFTDNYLHKNLDLSFLTGQSSVIFRFVFAVDGVFISGYNVDGMLMDNFKIVPVNLSPLGIEANSLVVKKQNDNANLLEWRANQLQYIEKFEIFRSTNGVDFISLHTLSKTDNYKTQYNFNDENITYLNTPYCFYQVFSIDYDGKKSASNIVKVQNSNFDINIFPNPINLGGTLNIQNYDLEKNIKFRILDVLSRVVLHDQTLNAENEIDIQYLKMIHTL
ncbi:MAG: hypothetical protein IPO26_19805 [Saprospiraceae bacterium]|nr:hypothetical protein [Saprospiraceae bacterium]